MRSTRAAVSGYKTIVASESTGAATMDEARARIAALEAALEAEREARRSVEGERDRVRAAFRQLQIEMELLRRRLFAAKAERVDTAQLEMEFALKRAELDALAGVIGGGDEDDEPKKVRRKPTGRRNLAEDPSLPIERVEVPDAEMEKLVTSGEAERIGFDESSTAMWRRGGAVRLVTAHVKYRRKTGAGETTLVTAKAPPAILPRAIGTPSLYAKIIADKFARGMPLFRQEEELADEGFPLDRGTMCRWVEELGMLAGATVVEAARAEAMRTAFCLATDATGVLVQPIRTHEKKTKRQACHRGHFFVQIADRDHVFFEYTPRETSDAVLEMFRGFSGYVQADAKSVYDILFRDPDEPPDDDASSDGARRTEVGCWFHARRKLYDAAIATHDPVAREGLYRIHRLFENEEKWRRLAPAQRKDMRDRLSRPELEDFFRWAELEFAKVKDERGLLRTALGYVNNQRVALARFLDDGRLEVDNNRSERELRRVAVGRKAWLFVGSDDHAQAAANLFSLVGSCKLHRLDPEAYLRDLFRVLPQWPRDRYLELAPKHWAATRARLDVVELGHEVGWLTIPPPPAAS